VKASVLKTAGLVGVFLSAQPLAAQVNVLTYHNDLARTGQNTNETLLVPGNVNVNTFGLLFAYPVDGHVYAQPLYVSGMIVPGKGARNVIFIATQHDSVFAFDADNNTPPSGGLLWHASVGTSAVTPNNDFGNRYGPYHDIDPEVGITSTPVIDLDSGTLYLDAFTHEGSSYLHRIHALNITNGIEQPYSPVVVRASVPGVGVGSAGGVVAFNPLQQLQRPALALAGGVLYAAYSGYADTDPYHGWVIGFNATNLAQSTNFVFITTPNSTMAAFGAYAGEGGIWMGGNGLSVDANTNLFLEVGNGSFNADVPGGTEYGESFLKLSTFGGLSVADYFTPFNQAVLSYYDTDLGSGGPLLLPDADGSLAHPHLLVGCGKEGRIYLLDRDNLGHYNSSSDSQIVQELPGAVGGTWSSPAYFNRQIYYQGNGDVMKAFKLANGLLAATPVSKSATAFGFPGATPAISANGVSNAIVWILQSDAYNSFSASGPAVLHAYNANNLAQQLYTSSQTVARDNPGGAVKFTVPTVANGKVYVGAQYKVSVFGNATFSSLPTITPAPGFFTNSALVSLATPGAGSSIYYTLDGSVPTTNSPGYAGPFIVANTTFIRAFAFKPGSFPSATLGALFVNAASASFSTAFLKQEFYPGASRSMLENPASTNAAAFLNYLAAFETPSGQGVNYAERVSGFFLPPQTGDYVFFVASDDDSDLFLSTDANPANKHLIATETIASNSRQWLQSAGGSDLASKRSDQFTGTAWPGGNTIRLTAGTPYYIEGVHHQDLAADAFAATFKLAADPDPLDGAPPKLAGNLIAGFVFDNTYVTVNNPPLNQATVQGYPATFSVGAESGYLGTVTSDQTPLLSYQWQSAPGGSSTFTNIPNANQAVYTTPPVALSDNGTQFQVVLTTAGFATNSPAAALAVLRDTSPPMPVRIVSASLDATAVTVAFSKPLDLASAQTASNYFFSSTGSEALNAMLDASGTNVIVSDSTALPEGTPVTLALAGVMDLAGHPVPPGANITFSIVAGGNGAVTTLGLAPPQLQFTSITAAVGQTVLQWIGNASLQEAPAITGPWSLVSNQSNPQIITISGVRFYRLLAN